MSNRVRHLRHDSPRRSQGLGISFSVVDKLRIAERLDSFGVHYIEGGWPGSNPKDIEFFEEAKRRTWRHAQLAAFGITRRKGVTVADDDQVRLLLDAKTPVVTIVGKTWLLHVTEVLQTTADENLAMIEDTVRPSEASRPNRRCTTPSTPSTVTRTNLSTRSRPQAAERGGADVIVLCDTNGGRSRRNRRSITRTVCRRLKTRRSASTRTTTSASAWPMPSRRSRRARPTCRARSTATASARATAIYVRHPEPRVQVQARVDSAGVARDAKEVSLFIDEIANMRPNPRLPWVGAAAFSHKGGQHVNAVQKLQRSYEHIDPALVGNSRHVLMSELAGRSNIIMKAQGARLRRQPRRRRS